MPFTPAAPTRLEAVLRNPEVQTLAGPLAAALLAWAWLVPAALDMYGEMRGLSAWMMRAQWSLGHGLMIFTMWTVMMAAMMLPALVPALLLYGGIARSDAAGEPAALRVNLFALGYLGTWAGFSALATLLQWQLWERGLLTMMMELADARLGAAVMMVAGVYQWTPLKDGCLSACRSPAGFISENWRRGRGGAAMLGLHYGLFCLGCCWALMLLLFCTGVMHLGFIVGLSLMVVMEKTVSWGRTASRVGGVVLVGIGVWELVGG